MGGITKDHKLYPERLPGKAVITPNTDNLEPKNVSRNERNAATFKTSNQDFV